jgi:hypothetical protein
MNIFNKQIDMSDLDRIPEPIKVVLDEAAKEYSNSNSTTNAGRILRFICRFLKPSTVIKMFAHKMKK